MLKIPQFQVGEFKMDKDAMTQQVKIFSMSTITVIKDAYAW